MNTQPTIEFTPRHDGIVAKCDCGSEMNIPSNSIKRFGLVWCPCGLLQQVGMDVLNKVTVLSMRQQIADMDRI